MRRLRSRLAWPLFLALNLLLAARGDAEKRRAFVTSITGTGNLSTWPGATGSTPLERGDSICRARATAAGLPNPTTYRAWLSTEDDDAYCHIQGRTGDKDNGCTGPPWLQAGPWYLVDGVLRFSARVEELTGPDGVIYRPVTFDEFGDQLPNYEGADYWTGTDADGTALAHTCGNWGSALAADHGAAGAGYGTAQIWTIGPVKPCNVARRLLCLEPGESDVTPSTWPTPASIVFVTSVRGLGKLGDWPAAGTATGLDAGDAICRQLAGDAHLPDPGSFIAWLSDSTHDAIDRLTAPGPYRRIDGIRIANTKADLTNGTVDSSIHQDEWGRYLIGGGGWRAYTGTNEFGLGIADFHCDDWTSDSGPAEGGYGQPAMGLNERWTRYSGATCDFDLRLYCFSNKVVLFWDGFEYSGDTTRWSSTTP